jgi:hypothetical protein
MVADTLRQWGINVVVCGTEEEARARAVHSKWDVLVAQSDLLDPTVASGMPFTMRPVTIVIGGMNGLKTGDTADFLVPAETVKASLQRIMPLVHAKVMKERQRYFRCPVEWPARIVGRPEIRLVITNISQNGAACHCSSILTRGSQLRIEFALPASRSTLSALASVTWADRKGAVGLRFAEMPEDQRKELASWLTSVFQEGSFDPQTSQQTWAVMARPVSGMFPLGGTLGAISALSSRRAGVVTLPARTT